MNKIILKAQNREELDRMIKRTMTLNEDEYVKVDVLKEPKKMLFFSIKGIYEIEIIKKSDISEKKEEIKKTVTEKETKNRNFEKKYEKSKENNRNDKKYDSNKNNNIRTERKNENIKNVRSEKIFRKDNQNKKIQNTQPTQTEIQSTVNTTDSNYDRIRSFMKEFIVNSKLDLTIVKIEKKEERYVVNVDGKDIRYLIGEKGSTLNSVEYLLSSIKQFKNIKIVIDSNNYKEKREESLRDLARKKGKKVLTTGKNIKLNPMSARERKIIHEEISFIKGLRTESVGEEPKRYLIIMRTKD